MNIILRNKIKKLLFIKQEEGRKIAAKEYSKTLSTLYREHEKQMETLIQNHSREIKLIEKDYNVKRSMLERKLQKLDDAIKDWEENVSQVKEMSVKSQELIARIKQVMYQDRRTFANVLDDEKSMEIMQENFNVLLQKQVSRTPSVDAN